MLLGKNKGLLIGAGAIVVVWLIIYYTAIDANWGRAKAAVDNAQQGRDQWEKISFKTPGSNLKKPEAEKALRDNNDALAARFGELKRIEFGSKETLKPYTVAAAGTNDPKNYLATMLKQTVEKAAKTCNVSVPSELNLYERTAEDPVSLNLIRLAMVDRLLLACKDASVPQIVKIQYFPPQLIPLPDSDTDEQEKAEKPKSAKGREKEKEKEAPDSEAKVERLVQFPMKVLVRVPERFFGQLLFEVQKPTDSVHGYFCINGYHVAVRDTGSGAIEAAVALSALLKEADVKDYGIPVKNLEGQDAGGGRQVDLQRGGY